MSSTGYSRWPLAAAVVVALALLVVGGVDYAITADKLPDPPQQCPPGETGCTPPSNDEFMERIQRSFELEDEIASRAWIYAAIAFAALLAGVALAARRAPGSREPFTDLGVFGVVWLVGAVVIALVASGGAVGVPTSPLFALGAALLVVAGLGTLATSPARARETEPRPTRSPWPALPRLTLIGLGLTFVAVVLALGAWSGRGDPCEDPVAPSSHEPLLGIAAVAAVAAAICGVASLVERRWIAALILIGTGPFVVLVAALASACWN